VIATAGLALTPLRHRSFRARTRQSGLVLAVILVLLTAGAITALLAFAASPVTTQAFDSIAQDGFAQARAALIGYSAMDDNRPGSLPCPDTNNDGIADLLVGTECPKNLGRLPWRTLGLPDLRDSSGEVLWYAVSPNMVHYSTAPPLNSNTIGILTVTGSAPATDVAAVLIAPGAALPSQVRDTANLNNADRYFEGENANFETSAKQNNTYQSGAVTDTFNDRIAVITRRQLFNVVEWRVAKEIRGTLQRYYTTNGYFPFANDYGSGTTGSFPCKPGEMRGRLPNPNSMNISTTCPGNADWNTGLSTPPPAWFFANDWHLLTYYSLASACTHVTPGCPFGAGYLIVNGVGTRHAIVIVGSAALSGQARPCVTANDCIEQPSAAIDQYQRTSVSDSFNDKLAVIP
jgi:hypothetical protein